MPEQRFLETRLSVLDPLLHDAGTVTGLIDRQLTHPFRNEFGLPVLLMMLGLALAVVWPLRLWVLARLSALLRAAPMETRLAISAKATGTVVLTTLFAIVGGQIAYRAFAFTLPLLPETDVLLRSLAKAIGAAGLGMGVGRALRSPGDAEWRPVALPAGLGRAIGIYPFAAGLVLGLTNFIDQVCRVLQSSETTWTVVQGLTVLVETLVIARFLVLAGKARQHAIETAVSGKTGPVVPAIFGATALVWAALAVGCGAFLFGQVRFSMLVLQELLWTALVLTMAWLLMVFFDALLSQLMDADWTVGRFATTVVGLRRERVKQVALIGSAVLTVLVWLFAIVLVAAPLHGDHAVVIEQIKPSELLYSMQSLKLSPRTVGAALFVLVVGIALTRMLRGWLENRFLPSTSLDIGVRTSVVTGLSYVGILIAILSATNMLGLQLEKITLIASALSVGIGFGLQSIIQNFVSGVIMLIERPVKPGDWIAVSGAEGTIRKIRVRATELATADGGTVIVPNSSFISSNVSNRADTLMPQRLDLALTVTGSPTAASARDAILELVGGCTLISTEPAPRLFLTSIGEGKWVFDLRAYALPDPSVAQARSDLLYWLSAQTEGKELKITSA